MMIDVIGVRFKPVGKIYYFDLNGFYIETDEEVMVETARRVGYRQVVIDTRQVEVEDVLVPLMKVVRIATRIDTDHVDENRHLAQEALRVCQKKFLVHQLDMNIVDAEYTFV